MTAYAVHGRFPAAARAPATPDVLRPAIWEIAAAGGLTLAYFAAYSAFGIEAYDVANVVGPLLLTAFLALGALNMVLRFPLGLWTGIFWFRVSTAVYFGVGSMIHIFFNDVTLQAWRRFFDPLPEQLFKSNALVSACVATVLSTAFFMTYAFPANKKRLLKAPEDNLMIICVVVFSSIGYSVKYLLLLPYQFGFFGNLVLPGAILSFYYLSPVGLFLLTLWSGRSARNYLFIPIILLLLDVVTGVLLFAKVEIIRPVIIFILASLQLKTNVLRITISSMVVVFTFMTIVPMVEYGRSEVFLRYGNIAQGELTERFEIMSGYFSGSAVAHNAAGFQGGMMRVAYGSVSAAAIALYDHGRPGSSFEKIWIIFIPRSLWPGKPILNDGSVFTQIINGNPDSNTWMGMFAEAYWNFGWWGVPLVMIPLGILFFFAGRMTIAIMEQDRWLHFPVVLLGMYSGMRVDGEFTPEIFATTVICIVLYFVANLAEGLLRPFLQKSQPHLAAAGPRPPLRPPLRR